MKSRLSLSKYIYSLTSRFHRDCHVSFWRPGFIEYTKFAIVVEEAVATAGLEKVPLVVPLQHVPSEASDRTFLNFDERQMVAIAMDKLCQVRSPNLEEVFKVSTAAINYNVTTYTIQHTISEGTQSFFYSRCLFSCLFHEKEKQRFGVCLFFRTTIRRMPARFPKDTWLEHCRLDGC